MDRGVGNLVYRWGSIPRSQYVMIFVESYEGRKGNSKKKKIKTMEGKSKGCNLVLQGQEFHRGGVENLKKVSNSGDYLMR